MKATYSKIIEGQKFDLGRIVVTRTVIESDGIDGREDLQPILLRHAKGDWGDTPTGDKELNDASIENGSRIISSYKNVGRDNEKVLIITEADRSATTILYPSEY